MGCLKIDPAPFGHQREMQPTPPVQWGTDKSQMFVWGFEWHILRFPTTSTFLARQNLKSRYT